MPDYRLFFAECYDLLYREGQIQGRTHDRDTFVRYFTEDRGTEYRFQGELGFGGKFWAGSNWGGCSVSCYSEDETPNRRRLMQKINREIKELEAKHGVFRGAESVEPHEAL